MKNKIISNLFYKKPKHKRQTTKLFTDDDKFLPLKVQYYPIRDNEILTVVLNERQALWFWITTADKVTIIKSNWERLTTNVVVSPKVSAWYLWVYENVLDKFPLEKWEVVGVIIAQSSSIANNAIRKKMKWEAITYDEMYAIIKDISEWKLSEVMMTYYVASSFFYPTTEMMKCVKQPKLWLNVELCLNIQNEKL